MQTAEYDYEDFDPQKQNAADKTLMVKFYHFSIKDSVATKAEGRPMFKEVEMIDIRVPGQRDGVARPASPRDKQRFPEHYAAFKNRTEAPIDGTPLLEWPAVSRSFADQLAFLNVKTVEQLAELNDANMHNIPGISMFKQKAKDWLEYTKDESIVGKLRDEIEERDGKITELSENLETLLARVEELEKPKPSRKKSA
jgi:hypothetical protein